MITQPTSADRDSAQHSQPAGENVPLPFSHPNITGDALWADRCEDVALNSLPAALTADLRALRYLTAPNLVMSDESSKSPGVQNGGPMFLMDPNQHRCCQHNVGHGWPYFVMHLWSATPDNGLAAVMYGASEVTAQVADGATVTIVEDTHYPFSDAVRSTLKTAQSVAFPLYARIPGWCQAPTVVVNGDAIRFQGKPGSFMRIQRTWKDGDTITLQLPMEIAIRTWEGNQNSISVDRGPLTYSLRIGEKYVEKMTALPDWPAYEIIPTTPWNYALVLDAQQPAKSFQVVEVVRCALDRRHPSSSSREGERRGISALVAVAKSVP